MPVVVGRRCRRSPRCRCRWCGRPSAPRARGRARSSTAFTASQQRQRFEGGVDERDGVEVGGRLLVDAVRLERRRLVERGHRRRRARRASSRSAATASPDGRLAVAEVGAEASTAGCADAHPLRARGHAAGSHERSRTMRTATSPNGTAMGASGLCTVTSHRVDGRMREHDAGDALGDGLDQVDRVAAHRLGDLLGELAVVHGGGEVVAARRRARRSSQAVTSTTKSWPFSRSKSKTPWFACTRSPVRMIASADPVVACLVIGPSLPCVHDIERDPRRRHVVHAHGPGAGLRGERADDRGRRVAVGSRGRPRAGARRGTACATPRRAPGSRASRTHAGRRGPASCARPVFENPSPGSRMSFAGSTPRRTRSVTRADSSARTSATVLR